MAVDGLTLQMTLPTSQAASIAAFSINLSSCSKDKSYQPFLDLIAAEVIISSLRLVCFAGSVPASGVSGREYLVGLRLDGAGNVTSLRRSGGEVVAKS